ncbi:jg3541 [Pararge aegeria aegeria]|uniref:Jg3541 protein n=1 Tax=Pararge aegeria aegeria TaxID=348720 RepID=A0A8S4QX74_9NEOP|nr:jg3541 [Pararge aegeria aegeria]
MHVLYTNIFQLSVSDTRPVLDSESKVAAHCAHRPPNQMSDEKWETDGSQTAQRTLPRTAASSAPLCYIILLSSYDTLGKRSDNCSFICRLFLEEEKW